MTGQTLMERITEKESGKRILIILNHKRLTKTFPRRELICFTKQILGIYPLGKYLS